MVRMLVQIRRMPGSSDEDFLGQWRGVHAPLVQGHAAAMGAVRYVQSRRIASPAIAAFAASRGWRAPPDGIAELWWPSLRAMTGAAGTAEAAAARAALQADERRFTAPGGQCGLLARPETVFDRTDALADDTGSPVKMVIEVWRRPGMTAEAFAERWHGAHADLARQVADAMGFARYVQNHRALDFPVDLAATRGWRPTPDGMSELWWTSEAAMMDALSRPEAAEASALLQADEAEFVHAPLMSAFLAREEPIFDRTAAVA